MIRLAAGLGGIAACLIGAKVLVASIEQRGMQKCEAAHLAVAMEAAQENQRLAIRDRARNQEVTDGLRKELQRKQAVASSAGALADRVRDAAKSVSGDPAEGGATARLDFDGERIAILGRLLGESVELVKEGRDRVDALTSKIDALQAYTTRVCLAK